MERDEDNSTLTLDVLDEDPMQDIHAHSVTYRIAMGPQRGRKVFTLQTILWKCREIYEVFGGTKALFQAKAGMNWMEIAFILPIHTITASTFKKYL